MWGATGFIGVVVVLGLGVGACGGDTGAAGDRPPPVTFAPGDDDEFFLFPEPVARDGSQPSDVVLDWMDRDLDLIQRERLGAAVATRIMAYTAVAIDAAVAVADDADDPAVAQVVAGGMALPDRPDGFVDPAVAASVAASEVTRNLIPTRGARRQATLLEQQHLEQATARHGQDLDASVQLGRDVAAAVLAVAANDGYDTIATELDVLPTGPGAWEPTPPDRRYPLEPEWGELTPFVVSDDDCPVPDPVAYSETVGSPFWAEANATYLASNNITDEQQRIVQHWSDRRGLTFTPAGHWVHILGEELAADRAARDMTLAEAARAFAVLSVVQADTFIANWKVKYRTNLLRPVTYIQRVVDPDWRPFLPTPPFPEYPSGHSAGSAASATVLTELLGDRAFTDTTHDRIGWLPRSYGSFDEAAAEASQSRLYAGIHYPMGLSAGRDQGRCIADTAIARLEGIGLPG